MAATATTTTTTPTASGELLALLISFGAALSTTVGALIAIFIRRDSKPILAASLAASAGVLIYVSLMDVMYEANEAFERVQWIGPGAVPILASTAFFYVGIGLVAALDWLTHRMQPEGVPGHAPDTAPASSTASSVDDFSRESALVAVCAEDTDPEQARRHKRQLRVAMLVTAVAVAIHNFPEGVAAYISTVRDPKVGLPIAFAIAVHNIPEGLCVALPIYFATGNRIRAVAIAAGTGLLEFIGALVAYLLPTSVFTEFFFGTVFAATAGMMIFVSFVELLPVARQHDPADRLVTKYIFVGMLIMAISLILLAGAGLS